MRWHDVVVRSLANGRGLDIPCMRAGTTYLLPDCRQKSATARWQSEVWRRSDGTDFRRARLSLNRDRKRSEQGPGRDGLRKLPIGAEPIPMIPAFLLRAPSVRFITLAIFATGVRAFECDLSSFRPLSTKGCDALSFSSSSQTVSVMPI
jgi:hypothetical protein